MGKRQIEIVTGYHTSGTPYVALVDRPDLRAEMLEGTDNTPENLAWLDDNADAINDIDARRIALMRDPQARERLNNAALPEWSDWDDLLRAWDTMLAEVEAGE